MQVITSVLSVWSVSHSLVNYVVGVRRFLPLDLDDMSVESETDRERESSVIIPHSFRRRYCEAVVVFKIRIL